jgi:predicted nucleic acid-binding protein
MVWRRRGPVLYAEDLNDGQEIPGVRIRNPFAG